MNFRDGAPRAPAGERALKRGSVGGGGQAAAGLFPAVLRSNKYGNTRGSPEEAGTAGTATAKTEQARRLRRPLEAARAGACAGVQVAYSAERSHKQANGR